MSLGETWFSLHANDLTHVEEDYRSLEDIKLDIEQRKRKEETKNYVKLGKYSSFNVHNCYWVKSGFIAVIINKNL